MNKSADKTTSTLSSNVFSPKQQRSIETQRKLLQAVNHSLQTKFFEHITIKELAEHAGVSVGTFYRRFKDKESLLPLLYQEFGQDLANWVGQQEEKNYDNLNELVTSICAQMLLFLQQKKGVFRTLHLNSRLHSEILNSDQQVDREHIYQRLSDLILRFESDITNKNKKQAAEMTIFIIINTLLDKVLYANLTPAIACQLNAEQFVEELPQVILSYLQG